MDIKQLLDQLCQEFILEETRKKFKYRLITPFTFPNGELIEFVIEFIDKDTIVLDDLALIYRYYDLNFFDPKSTALDKISNICQNYQISNHDSFTKEINLRSSYAIYDIYDFINALIRLSDVIFLKSNIKEKRHFVENLIKFVEDEVSAKYKYISAGIAPYDEKDEFKVDIALSNNKERWVIVNGILNQNQAIETNLSIVHYKYLGIELESILVFEDLDKFAKGKKLNRLLGYADTTVPTFDLNGKSKLKEIVNRRLK